MTYNEKNFKLVTAQLELAKKGFEELVKEKTVYVSATPLFDELEPYFDAVKDLKDARAYYEKEMKSERAGEKKE